MALYHVFVDGAADASPAGNDKLAAAVAAHYGLPVADLQARIASGRFRVKGNCDRATADSYIRDLTALGARCSLEEASPSNAAKTPLPFPAVTAQPAQPPQPSGRPSQSALPPRQTTPPSIDPQQGARTATPPKGFQSGLAAAFSGEQQVDNLGALDDGALLKLSSVDGKEEAPSPAAFAPPPAPAPSKPDGKAKPAAPAKPKDEPIDMFAPPDADDANFQVDLAPEEIARAAKKKASIPPETAPVEPARASRPSLQVPNEPARASRPSIAVANERISSAPAATGLRDPKTRFAVGVVIAIVLGFVPAHFIAHLQESSAFAAVDANVVAVQHDAVTPDDYATLDTFRAGQLARKHDERRNIALLAMLIWAAAGAGIAYVWFRRIPWDREPAA
ncbi:MAG TPA: hypothetical protein VFQ65_30775 [Kofleriaceae bacterium]|nr:hypothetical protein [Kofleriaceae bacterium]